MKNEIAYFFHLYPEKIIKKGNHYHFTYQNKKYTFSSFTRSLEEVEPLFILNQALTRQNVFFPKIIQNQMGQVLTYLNNKYYYLKEEILPDERVTFQEVIYPMHYTFPKEKLKNIERYKWPFLWESKIDYFEYQREHIYQKFPRLSEGLDYFIGLGENAISYIKTIEKNYPKTEKDELTFTRRRVKATTTLSDFYDPTSFVIDYKVRDIAEFLKSCFFDTDISENELEKWLEQLDLSSYGWGMLLGRLLFPTYFFDLYEKIINGKEQEIKIENVLQRVDAYQEFLANLQTKISKNNPIPIINWLKIKKEVL